MRLGEIKAVFFDAVGTLIHPSPSPAEVYARIGALHGSRLTSAEIGSRFIQAFERQEERDLKEGLRTSEEREMDRWRTIVGTVLDDVDDAESCFQALFQHFALPDAWTVDPQGSQLLAELAGRGFLLGMASNYDQRLKTVAAGLPALDHCPQVMISSEIGWRKPARQFFSALCRQAALPAQKILYVGDDRFNDYDGARRAELCAVLLDPRGKARDVPHVISSLAELPALL